MTGFMNHMTETGKLTELQKKWFGETYELPKGRSQRRSVPQVSRSVSVTRRATAARFKQEGTWT